MDCKLAARRRRTRHRRYLRHVIGVGDFNGDNLSDLVIGVPKFDDGTDPEVGGTQTLYQSEFIFRAGFD